MKEGIEMNNNELSNLVKEAKNDCEKMQSVLLRLQPLIKSYVKKLFFMEVDDAEQEIILAIIKAVKTIKNCNSDGECLAYIQNAVRFKQIHLCKKNINREKNEDLYEKNLESRVYLEKYDDINIMVDFDRQFSALTEEHKKILGYLLLEYSDIEVASKVGKSRQYINRIKKKLICWENK